MKILTAIIVVSGMGKNHFSIMILTFIIFTEHEKKLRGIIKNVTHFKWENLIYVTLNVNS